MLDFLIILFGVVQFMAVIVTIKIIPWITGYFDGPYSSNGVIVFSTDSRKQRTTTSEVFVDAAKANCILGPGSEILGTIGQKYNTKVVLTPPSESDEEHKVRKIIVIGGWQPVAQAEREVRSTLQNPQLITTQIMYVPSRAVGMLIGKKGAHVKEMSRVSCARINIASSENCEPESSVIIRGSVQAVALAQNMLEQKVVAWKMCNWHS